MFWSLFQDHFQRIKNVYALFTMLAKKAVSVLKIKILKHFENLLKVSNEINQYIKNTIVFSLTTLSKFSQYKIIKIKNNAVVTSYRQISLKNTLIIDTVGSYCFATTPINITRFWFSAKLCHNIALITNK